jgi:hemolysin activation/secretion protein
MWLSSFSVSSQAFFKSKLIFDFGRTEDIPFGMRITLTMGPEINEFNSRLYTGLSLSQGRYIGKFGYLYTRIEGGGFLRDDLYFEQGVINTEINYFSPLIIINRFKFRHFVNARYVRGIRRFEDEFIGINDLEGIRGFRSSLPLGQQKTILNYEINAFTPYYLYGFRFVIFGFADAGIVGPEYKKWHDGEFFSGLGVGVRIRNERLVFETITLRLGYYANHPERSFPLFLDIYGEQRLNPDNFFVTKPDIIGFE